MTAPTQESAAPSNVDVAALNAAGSALIQSSLLPLLSDATRAELGRLLIVSLLDLLLFTSKMSEFSFAGFKLIPHWAWVLPVGTATVTIYLTCTLAILANSDRRRWRALFTDKSESLRNTVEDLIGQNLIIINELRNIQKQMLDSLGYISSKQTTGSHERHLSLTAQSKSNSEVVNHIQSMMLRIINLYNFQLAFFVIVPMILGIIATTVGFARACSIII